MSWNSSVSASKSQLRLFTKPVQGESQQSKLRFVEIAYDQRGNLGQSCFSCGQNQPPAGDHAALGGRLAEQSRIARCSIAACGFERVGVCGFDGQAALAKATKLGIKIAG
jgi:hypothetical protein